MNDQRHHERTSLAPVRAACPTPAKASWVSRRAAKAALRECRDRLTKDPRTGRKPQVYACPCGAYHLGHLPASVIRGNAARADLRRTP